MIQYQRIDAFYDHTILIDGNKIRVIEDYWMISEKLDRAHEQMIVQQQCFVQKVGDYNGR